MGFYNVVNAASMQTGQPEDVSQVLANFNAIASVLNGGVDNSNVSASAAIALTKLAAGSAGRILGMDQTPNAIWVPGLQQIQEIVLSTPTASFDFQNIPQTFHHLVVLGFWRATGAATNMSVGARYNNDSTNTYGWQGLYLSGGTVTPASSGTYSSQRVGLGDSVGSDQQYSGFTHVIPSYYLSQRRSSFALSGGYTGASDHVGLWGGRYYGS